MFRSLADRMFVVVMATVASLVGAMVVGMFVFLAWESRLAIAEAGVAELIFGDRWQPSASGVDGSFGLAPMIVASVMIPLGSVMLALPLAMATSIWAEFYGHRLAAGGILRCMELMNGIPSVVIGFWGLTTVVPLIGAVHSPGTCLLSAMVVLATMILPGLVIAFATTWQSVPESLMRSATAAGLRRWVILARVILPAVKKPLTDSVVMQTGRAIGETMVVLMVSGNVVHFQTGLLTSVRPLTANIALEMAYAQGVHRSALFFSGLLLLSVVFLTLLLTRFSRNRHGD